MQRHLDYLSEIVAPGLVSRLGISLPEGRGNHLIVERKHVARTCEAGRQLHKLEDRLYFGSFQAVDIVDQHHDTLAGLLQHFFDLLLQFVELHTSQGVADPRQGIARIWQAHPRDREGSQQQQSTVVLE